MEEKQTGPPHQLHVRLGLTLITFYYGTRNTELADWSVKELCNTGVTSLIAETNAKDKQTADTLKQLLRKP
jgi:hypothetical protein